MANVRKRGDKYIIEVYKGRTLSGKKIVECTTFTPDAAKTMRQNEKALQAFVLEFERKVKDGRSRGDAVTLQNFAERWLKEYGEKELERTTFQTYRDSLRLQLLPRAGFMKLSDIRPLTVQNILNDMREKGYSYGSRRGMYSEETIRTARTVLSSVMSAAVENGYITQNPCSVRQRKHKHKKVSEKVIRCFTAEQAALFMDIIENPIPIMVDEKTHMRRGKPVKIKAHQNGAINVPLKYRAIFLLTLFSGCRRGEIIALTWKNVDFKKNTVHIRQSAARVDGKQYVKTPKTQSGYREIYMPAAVMDVLKELKRQQRKDILALGTAWKGSRNTEDNFCFTQATGEMMGIETPNNELRKVLRAYNKACTDEKKRLPEITLHELRHTSASVLIAQGLDVQTVAARLGHADSVTTLKIYSHAFTERDRDAATALERVLLQRATSE